jgi:predicted N-acyltransferase
VRGASVGVAMALESPVSRAQVYAALPDLVAGAAAELGCRSHAILHVEDDGALRERAAALGYTRVVLGAETALDIPAVSNQEEYFAALSRRRRYRLRAEKRQYAAQGLRTKVLTGPAAMTEDLILLQARQREKHGMSGDIEPVRQEFDRIRETVGDAVVVLSAERDGQVLGYTLCLYDKDRNELFARSAGFNYDALDGGCYFALMFHEVPAWAADHGVRRIFFGMSTYEAKRARGCVLLPLYGHLRFDGPDGDLLHRAAHLQSTGEARRLEALGANVTR